VPRAQVPWSVDLIPRTLHQRSTAQSGSMDKTREEGCGVILGTDGTRVPAPVGRVGWVWRSLSSREISVTILPDSRDFESASDLSQRLGLHFSNLALLTRALTHRSYVNENPNSQEDNERLEFLGDAVLDFIVGAWVYNRFPEMREGELTKIRSAIVRNDQLATFARHLNLGAALRLGRGEFASGGRQRDGLLGSLFEAVVGALYLDGDLKAVQEFVYPLLEASQEFVLDDIHDPKSRLQEWAQAEKMGTPQYVTLNSSGPDHAKTFEVEVRIKGLAYGRGHGSSKQVAARIAAQTALESLGLSYK
jgi:ribonuclease-3